MKPKITVTLAMVLALVAINSRPVTADEAEAEKTNVDIRDLKEKAFVPSFASVDKDGNLQIFYTVYVPVVVERIEKGEDGDRRITETRLVPEQRLTIAEFDTVKVFDANWKQLDQKQVGTLLQERSKIFITKSDMRPMANVLKKLGKDAIIIFQKPRTQR